MVYTNSEAEPYNNSDLIAKEPGSNERSFNKVSKKFYREGTEANLSQGEKFENMPKKEDIVNALKKVLEKEGPEIFIKMIKDIQHTRESDLELKDGKDETWPHRLIKCIFELKNDRCLVVDIPVPEERNEGKGTEEEKIAEEEEEEKEEGEEGEEGEEAAKEIQLALAATNLKSALGIPINNSNNLGAERKETEDEEKEAKTKKKEI